MAAKKKQQLTIEEKMQQALVPQEEQPYKIPDNWCWVYIINGFAECLDKYRKPINANERAKRIGNIPYYGATGQVGWIDDYLTDDNLVLIGEDGAPFLDLLKDKAYIINGKAWVNNHAHILKSFYSIYGNKYLCYYLNIFDYKNYINGTTRLKLTQKNLELMYIPLPPLNEQQRIVNVIESLFAKLDEAKQLIQNTIDKFEQNKMAILHKAFNGELTAKWREENNIDLSSWQTSIIKDIGDVKGGKRLPKGESLIDENTGYPYIKAGNLKNGTVLYKELQYLEPQVYEKIKNYTVKTNDVYITIVGACIGDVGIIPKEVNGANLTENAAKITNLKCNAKFLSIQLSTTEVQKQIKNKIASATLGKLSLQNIKSLEIKLPTIKEQQEIVKIMDEIFAKYDKTKTLQNQLDKIELLKKSILAKAFRGELGTNDPNEESAEVLLRGILAEK
ncbi:restriction endonuclease subunit S [Megamonas hypermegale]|uniref:restriction endonuclease subunit S n=1 Tax=Megamonas hypermegale TaxID=158847 RepID=UPI0026F34AA6|nr:restriction endonuclease subunit S [Megamonas hypermegale]